MAISLSNNKHSAKKTSSRLRRQIRVRKKVNGTADRPRLVVSKSSKHLFAQVIDDVAGVTLVSASTMESDLRGDVLRRPGDDQPGAVRRAADALASSDLAAQPRGDAPGGVLAV